MHSTLRHTTALFALAVLAACAGDPPATAPEGSAAFIAGGVQPSLTLRSPFIKDGDPFPAQFACPAFIAGPNDSPLAGDNISPSLNWSNPPAGTVEFAVVLDDAISFPDFPARFTHWMTWGLDRNTRTLKRGENGPFVGNNDLFGYAPLAFSQAYFGACPPRKTGLHRYVFHVYALSRPLGLAAGATRDQFDAALAGKVLAEAKLSAPYDTGL
jgi:Raf kinase inhibitor-like YbhB/YbcL family protein